MEVMALDIAFYNDAFGHTPVSEFLFSLSEKSATNVSST